MKENVLVIKNMNCIHCKGRIEKAMERANIACDVNLENKSVTLVCDDATLEEAKAVITKAGYVIL